MTAHHLGQAAALGTAVCWTLSAVCFDTAGRRIGSMPVNLLRLVVAWLLLAVYGVATAGCVVPLHATRAAWAWLSISGLVGLFLGDLCLFRAYLVIGPRLSLLVMSLAPPTAALLGWLAMGERLAPRHWLGMGVTLAGVAWVIAGTPGALRTGGAGAAGRRLWGGLLLALAGAVGQAAGMVLGKLGLGGVPDVFAATQIRATSGLLGFALLFLVLRDYGRVAAALRDARALALVAAGGAIGPLLGVALMLYAMQRIPTGLAQTFVALTPVLIIPFSVALHRERITARSVIGAVVAFAGIAILSWGG